MCARVGTTFGFPLDPPAIRRLNPDKLRNCTPLPFRRRGFRKKAVFSVLGMLRCNGSRSLRPEKGSVDPPVGLTVHYVRVG